jgi:DNA topoisomerase-1
VDKTDLLREFYGPFAETLEKADESIGHVELPVEVSDVPCDICGRMMVVKQGRFGKFLACPGFPECKNTKPYYEKIGVQCPKCGKDIVMKRTRKGRIFYGCIDNPECDFMSWARPVSTKCPKCGSLMVAKSSKLVCTNTDCGFVCNKDELEKNN